MLCSAKLHCYGTALQCVVWSSAQQCQDVVRCGS
jgi:hypothetical protein